MAVMKCLIFKKFNKMDEIKKTFLEDGVVLLKNLWSSDVIQRIAEEYDAKELKISRTSIPDNQPVIVLWIHTSGGKKRIGLFTEFPKLWTFISNIIVPNVRKLIFPHEEKLRLLETVIFSKPYKKSNKIHWHQDSSTWPLSPSNQFAVWIPFEVVEKESGALHYAFGSHKAGKRCSVDLTSNKPYENDERKLIPKNPESEGFKIKCMEMNPTDMICYHADTWHSSEPNNKFKTGRRALSIRFIRGNTTFDPHLSQEATFVKQLNLKKGDSIEGSPFPIL